MLKESYLKLKVYQKGIKSLFKRFVNLRKGSSYWHLSQGIGKCFVSGELKGYYNDLTGKISWNGPQDNAGVPLTQFSDGRKVYFPTTIAQKALGHYDIFLISKDDAHLREFLNLCEWLVNNQDRKGGWSLQIYKEVTYSAMSQGEAVSCLVRAYNITNDERFLESTKRALKLMLNPIESGGCTYYYNEDIYLEEFPSKDKNTILNGWIFSIFGIYDYYLLTRDKGIEKVLNRTISTLKKSLALFDSGFWSYYDEKKNIASPFYHDLHINQLQALYLITNDQVFKNYQEKWGGYKRKFINKNLALLVKIYQKLKNPPEVMTE